MSTDSAARLDVTAAAWLRATAIGWFVGFLVMLALIFAGEVLGATQSMIGIGMGGGLGYWQSRLLYGVLERPWRWALASAAGMGAPFVLWDLSPVLGVESWFSLPVCVVAGGLAVALWQWRLLDGYSERAILWVPACAVGWAMPALTIAMSDADWVAEPWGTGLGLCGMFFGGVMLGAVTAKPLAGMLRAGSRSE